jgi:hypothetical protein
MNDVTNNKEVFSNESPLSQALNRLTILYKYAEQVDILSLRYDPPISDSEVERHLIEKSRNIVKEYGVQIKQLPYTLSDVLRGEVNVPGLLIDSDLLIEGIDEIPQDTLLFMKADIGRLSNEETSAFGRAVVPNLGVGERHTIRRLVDKHSALVFVFSLADYNLYISRMTEFGSLANRPLMGEVFNSFA